jgi:tripartite-type tricarboxylate transporter receptor subunit TctC
MRKVAFATVLAATVCLTLSLRNEPAMAQAYPSKPVHIIITTPAGGLADVVGRTIAEELHQILGQPVVVDNKPGASGKIGTELAARAAPDGYTLLFTNPSSHTLPVLADPNPTFDPIKDFAPIARTAKVAYFLIVRPTLPAQNLRELIALGKKEPGKLNFANNAFGSSAHFAAVLFAQEAGIEVVHVAYKGENPVSVDLMGGQVDLAFLSGAKQLVESGKLKALGVSTLEPFPTMPTVPPIASAGLPGFHFEGWHGMLAPAKTPPEIIAKLNDALHTVQKSDRLKKVLMDNGAAPAPLGPPEDLTKSINDDLTIGRKLIAEHKIKLE